MNEWEEITSKSVQDSDGFLTDYTMYQNLEDGTYIFIFGDKDLYTPENSDPDWECESEEEAYEWFNDYVGFAEDEYEAEARYEEESARGAYEIVGYYDSRYAGVAHDISSNDWSVIEEAAHEYLNEGLYVEITNTILGTYIRISPDEYENEGEFPIKPEDLWDGSENIESSETVTCGYELDPEKEAFYRQYPSKPSDEYMDMGSGLFYWYYTPHGVGPGSVPRGLNIIDVISIPYGGDYFLTDRVLTTKSLQYYDIQEKAPEGVE